MLHLFSDVDECSMPKPPCDTSYDCINTIGSFICRCPPGTREDNNKCHSKKTFTGSLRATKLDFGNELHNRRSDDFKKMEMVMLHEVTFEHWVVDIPRGEEIETDAQIHRKSIFYGVQYPNTLYFCPSNKIGHSVVRVSMTTNAAGPVISLVN
jgi:hypothetical protein